MTYLKAAIAMTLGVYTSSSFISYNLFQMGWFVVARFLLTSALHGSSAIAELLVYFYVMLVWLLWPQAQYWDCSSLAKIICSATVRMVRLQFGKQEAGNVFAHYEATSEFVILVVCSHWIER